MSRRSTSWLILFSALFILTAGCPFQTGDDGGGCFGGSNNNANGNLNANVNDNANENDNDNDNENDNDNDNANENDNTDDNTNDNTTGDYVCQVRCAVVGGTTVGGGIIDVDADSASEANFECVSMVVSNPESSGCPANTLPTGCICYTN